MFDGKYSYKFVLDEETVRRGDSSHAKLLQMVSPGATVLECGPADGVMTRYLKEKMNCRVYILEIDPVYYAQAIHYADGGTCASLEDDSWMEQFVDCSFDCILFADVLEHLRDPQSVLAKMKRLLKADGSILLSVPNIAHGDILMNLLCDRFHYTPLGLLDNTHIHFFAREDLREMVRHAGYFLAFESCTRVPLFATEQGASIPVEMRARLEQALAEHKTRNVYQFVCRLVKTETKMVSEVETDAVPAPESRFYLDLGEGYSEKEQLRVTAMVRNDGRLIYQIPLPEGCVAARFDPVECQKCILQGTKISVDGFPVESVPLNGLRVGSVDFFCDEDPQLAIRLPHGGSALRLETALTVLGANSWREIANFVANTQSEMKQLLELKEDQLQAANVAKAQIEAECSIVKSRLQSAAQARILAEGLVDKAQVRVAMVEQQLAEQTQVCLWQRSKIDALCSSTSWKLTKPLRALKRILSPKGRF